MMMMMTDDDNDDDDGDDNDNYDTWQIKECSLSSRSSVIMTKAYKVKMFFIKDKLPN